MDKRLLDYDPDTHTTQWHYYDPGTDQTTIETVQDVEPYLKHAAELRKNEGYSSQGIKESFWHYCHLPEGIQTQIYNKYGVKFGNEDDNRAMLKIIDQEYPNFKTTRKKHA